MSSTAMRSGAIPFHPSYVLVAPAPALRVEAEDDEDKAKAAEEPIELLALDKVSEGMILSGFRFHLTKAGIEKAKQMGFDATRGFSKMRVEWDAAQNSVLMLHLEQG